MSEMLARELHGTAGSTPQQLDSIELFYLCARNREETSLWTEFLRRFTPNIMRFIRGTLRQLLGNSAGNGQGPLLAGGNQESDFFQSTITRLVEKDCAAMKRFSGTTENELLAYLAVISRSIIQDCLRRQRALKRPQHTDPFNTPQVDLLSLKENTRVDNPQIDRNILARELAVLGQKTIRSLSGKESPRDRLIFQLYFFHDLSANQIARCKGIVLSKAGVEKVLARVTERVRMLASAGESEATIK